MPDIFISYARKDRERVELLAEALLARGMSVWWDSQIRYGQKFHSQIKNVLDQANCVIVAWSRNSIESDWVLDEAGQGAQRNILIPIIIEEGVTPPLGFRGIQTADLTLWLNNPTQDASFESLCTDIAVLLGRPSSHFRESPASKVPKASINTSTRVLRMWPWIAFAFFVAISASFVYNVYYHEGTNTSKASNLDTTHSKNKIDPLKTKDVPSPSLFFEIQLNKGRNDLKPYSIVKIGDTISTRDGYRIVVFPTKEMFVYVIQIDSHGKINWLFPKNTSDPDNSVGKNPAPANNWLYLPQNGWYYLDNNTGKEEVYVLGSYKPWLDLESKLHDLLSSQRQEDGARQIREVLKTRGVGGIADGTNPKINDIDNKTKVITLFKGLDSTVVAEKWFHHAK